MTNLFGLAGGAVLAALGLLHLIYTLRDIAGPPRHFAPRDEAVLTAMQATRVRLAPRGRDYWQALLGFHLSHSMAVLMLAGIVVSGSLSGPSWHLWTGLGITLVYAAVAWRFWFAIPMWGCVTATVLQAAGIVLN